MSGSTQSQGSCCWRRPSTTVLSSGSVSSRCRRGSTSPRCCTVRPCKSWWLSTLHWWSPSRLATSSQLLLQLSHRWPGQEQGTQRRKRWSLPYQAPCFWSRSRRLRTVPVLCPSRLLTASTLGSPCRVDMLTRDISHCTPRPPSSPQGLILSSTDWKDQMVQDPVSPRLFPVSNLASGRLSVVFGVEVE